VVAEGARRRPRRTAGGIARAPWRRLVNPFRPVEILSADEVEAIHRASLRILDEIGIEVLGAAALDWFRADGARVDLATRTVRLDPARVEELVALADVVKVSDEDLLWLHPEHTPVETAARWASLGPGLVVVTRGGEGAVAVRHDGTTLDVPGVPVTVADTVGAGDTFSGVLIDALLELGVAGPEGHEALRALSDRDVLGAVTTAAIGAAINVSRPGADPPSRAELSAALGEPPARAGEE